MLRTTDDYSTSKFPEHKPNVFLIPQEPLNKKAVADFENERHSLVYIREVKQSSLFLDFLSAFESVVWVGRNIRGRKKVTGIAKRTTLERYVNAGTAASPFSRRLPASR